MLSISSCFDYKKLSKFSAWNSNNPTYPSNFSSSRVTGEHSNLPGHSRVHWKVTVLEQSRSNEEDYIRERGNILLEYLTHTIMDSTENGDGDGERP